jgi:hypothetical protein
MQEKQSFGAMRGAFFLEVEGALQLPTSERSKLRALMVRRFSNQSMAQFGGVAVGSDNMANLQALATEITTKWPSVKATVYKRADPTQGVPSNMLRGRSTDTPTTTATTASQGADAQEREYERLLKAVADAEAAHEANKRNKANAHQRTKTLTALRAAQEAADSYAAAHPAMTKARLEKGMHSFMNRTAGS